MIASAHRITHTFTRLAAMHRTALIPYIVAGDPIPQVTVPLLHALVKAGADILELGVPFSDPMADGPTIQRATQRAVAQGVGLSDVLEIVAQFRQQDVDTPIVLMGYANSIECMGQAAFADSAKRVGVDGVLVVDYPPEEIEPFAQLLQQQAIDPIFLLAPTSSEARIQKLASLARGYVYYVSLKGVTGASHINLQEVVQQVGLIRRHISLPVAVGFGIKDVNSAQQVARVADAIVIGSKLVEVIENAVKEENAVQPCNDIKDIYDINDVRINQLIQAAVTAAKQWLSSIREALEQPLH